MRLPWPAAQARGIGSSEGLTSGTLPHRCCNGNCSYVSRWFERVMSPLEADPDCIFGGCCKTAFRPCDLAVTAFLLIAHHHLAPTMVVRKRRDEPQWKDARALCQWEIGYGATYRIGPARRLTMMRSTALSRRTASRW